MTREEAIRKLQKQKAEYLEEWVDFSGVAEAYDMAIEALELSDSIMQQLDCKMFHGAFKSTGDSINRQAAIGAADSTDYTGLAIEDVKKVTDEVIKALKQLPPAQPEIIRCKDCKHADQYNHCDRVTFWNAATDYCSRAERREDERQT